MLRLRAPSGDVRVKLGAGTDGPGLVLLDGAGELGLHILSRLELRGPSGRAPRDQALALRDGLAGAPAPSPLARSRNRRGLRAAAAAERQLENAIAGARRLLRIGAFPSILATFVPAAIAAAGPLEVSAVQGSTDELVAGVPVRRTIYAVTPPVAAHPLAGPFLDAVRAQARYAA
jgi:hypothetical protein